MDNEPKGNEPTLDKVVEDATRMSDTDTKLFDTMEAEVVFKRDEQADVEQAARAEQLIAELNEINQRFKMHQPTAQQIVLMEDLTKTYAYLAKMILALCPRCADRTHAIRQLQDSKMWANTAIMLEGKI